MSQTSSPHKREMGTHGVVVTEFPNTPITTVKFDGTNYLTWSKSIIIHVQGKDKEDYLTGEAKKPSKDNPRF